MIVFVSTKNQLLNANNIVPSATFERRCVPARIVPRLRMCFLTQSLARSGDCVQGALRQASRAKNAGTTMAKCSSNNLNDFRSIEIG